MPRSVPNGWHVPLRRILAGEADALPLMAAASPAARAAAGPAMPRGWDQSVGAPIAARGRPRAWPGRPVEAVRSVLDRFRAPSATTIPVATPRSGAAAPGPAAGAGAGAGSGGTGLPLTLYTFGDSILDCGWYNEFRVHPGQLLVRNDDELFPEFRGRDLSAHGPARLVHRAVDGATVADLPAQARGLPTETPAVAILTVGGNDLLRGLLVDDGPGIDRFAAALDAFLRDLPIRPVFLGNVYDPTFGVDAVNFTGVDPALARDNHRRLNAAIAAAADRHGELLDLHAHFLGGDPSWYARTIEPSLRGASEVRRCFLPRVLAAFGPPG